MKEDTITALPDPNGFSAFDFFIETYGVKYEKAVAKLIKGRDTLLAFYDFTAERAQALGNTSEPAIQSKVPSQPCAIEPAKSKAA